MAERPIDGLLTVRDLAAWLGVAEASIYGWRYRGEGPPAVKVFGRVRFRRADVDAWLTEQSRDEPRQPTTAA